MRTNLWLKIEIDLKSISYVNVFLQNRHARLHGRIIEIKGRFCFYFNELNAHAHYTNVKFWRIMVEISSIIDSAGEIALICESPHKDEVFHGYPLAGNSGRNISKYLIGRYDVPIGLIANNPAIKDILGLSDIKKFSLLNISKKPLQLSAYEEIEKETPENINCMENLKKILEKGKATFETVHKNKTLNELKNNLYLNFQLECKGKLKNHVLIVPCGNFSKVFCQKLQFDNVLPKAKFIYDFPHPIKGWSGVRQELLNEVSLLRNITNECSRPLKRRLI